jgi:hypothetical protein
LDVNQPIDEFPPAPFLGPPEIRLDAVADCASGLTNELAANDLLHTVAQIASLLTLPEFHANSVRLEVLMHLAVAHCAGQQKPTWNEIGRWLNESLAPLAHFEDPVEDVFITNVISGLGNHRMFEGLWVSGDFWTQNALDVLSGIPNDPHGARLRWHVGALLKLSEELAERSGVKRWAMGGGDPGCEVQIPNDDALSRLSLRVLFNQAELERLRIDLEALEPFLLANTRSETGSDEIGCSALERRPLLLIGDKIVFALPTATSTAIRRFLIEECHKVNKLGVLWSALRQLQGIHLFGELMTPLKGTDLRIPSRPTNLDEFAPFDDGLCTFDTGRTAHVVLLHDDLREVEKHGFSQPQALLPNKMVALANYLERTAQASAEQPGYQGGLTLVVLGGMGRGSALGIGELPKKWHFAVLSLADLDLVSSMTEMSLLRLWKMKEQLEALERLGTFPKSIDGDVAFLSYWYDQGWSFVPADAPFRSSPHLMIGIASDWMAKVRQDLRSGLDSHAVPTPSGRFTIVTRFHRDSWFTALKRQPVFVSKGHLKQGVLAGLVETSKRAWWVRVVEPREQLKDSDFIYRFWGAILNWMCRLAPRIDELLPGSDPIVVEIETSQLDAIERSLDQLASIQPENPKAEVQEGQRIRILLPIGFLAVLREPSNLGEKELCRTIAMAAANRCGIPWSERFEEIVGQLFLDPGGREFHVKQTNDFRDLARLFHNWTPRHLQPEDREWSKLGLAWLVEEPQQAHRIVGKDSCVQFLNDLVDKVWLRIRAKLREVSRISFVSRCMERIEANATDAEEWRLAARAHSALDESREEILRVSREQEANRASVAVAARAAIEMATCESPVEGNDSSEADLDTILADLNELLLLASQSDAIRHGYADPYIDVLPSGRLLADDRFFSTVLTPYATDFYASTFKDAVDSYERILAPNSKVGSLTEVPLAQEFGSAFTAEFGVSPEVAVEISFFLEQEALDSQQIIVRKSPSDIETLLLEKTRAPAKSMKRFLERLTLPVRQRWDETEPAGFSARDWYPWRFRRRLSLIARPIVQIDEHDLVYSPAFLDEGLRYLLENAYSADLPADFFSTPEMRAWIGYRTQQRGERFNDLVLQRVQELGLSGRARVLMSELGVAEGAGDFRQSDVDVLAWSIATGFVFVIECKRLIFAKTIGEISDQLDDFRLEKDPTGKNNLARHMERFNWLNINRTELQRITGVPATGMKLRPLIVTSRTVPMQFVNALPGSEYEITSLDNLSGWLSEAGRRA